MNIPALFNTGVFCLVIVVWFHLLLKVNTKTEILTLKLPENCDKVTLK